MGITDRKIINAGKIERYLKPIYSPLRKGYAHVNKFDVRRLIRKLRDEEYIYSEPQYYLRSKRKTSQEEDLNGVMGRNLRMRGGNHWRNQLQVLNSTGSNRRGEEA